MSTRRACIVACLAALVLVGCGAPPPGTTTVFDPRDVPYDLLATAAPTTGPTGAATTAPADASQVWLVQDGVLVPTAVSPVPTGPPMQQGLMVLTQLAGGPSSSQQRAGLSSALRPGVVLELRDVVDGNAQVWLHVEANEAPAAATEAPLAAGQIVLTLTSVDGIDSVTFDDGQTPEQIPLPGGALTDEPVTAQDYASLRS